MDFGYDYVLSTLNYGKDFQQQTYWMTQREEEITDLQTLIAKKTSELPVLPDDVLEDCKTRSYLEKLFKSAVNAEKKKLQGQLDSWKNKHVGKKWDDAWKNFKSYSTLFDEIQKLENQLVQLSKVDETIQLRKSTLEQLGFIHDNHLTQKGLLACNIHEGHPLLMAEMFHQKLIHDEPI
jgi:superfamily II RNA helicase